MTLPASSRLSHPIRQVFHSPMGQELGYPDACRRYEKDRRVLSLVEYRRNSPGDNVVKSLKPRESTWRLFAYESVETAGIRMWPRMANMWDTYYYWYCFCYRWHLLYTESTVGNITSFSANRTSCAIIVNFVFRPASGSEDQQFIHPMLSMLTTLICK